MAHHSFPQGASEAPAVAHWVLDPLGADEQRRCPPTPHPDHPSHQASRVNIRFRKSLLYHAVHSHLAHASTCEGCVQMSDGRIGETKNHTLLDCTSGACDPCRFQNWQVLSPVVCLMLHPPLQAH